MAGYVPTVGDQIYLEGRPSTVVDVIAIDDPSQLMWVRPVGGGRPVSVKIVDRWTKVVPHPTIPDVWHVITATAISRGFASRAGVMNNLPADAVAVMHVKADATVDIEWLPVAAPPPPPPAP